MWTEEMIDNNKPMYELCPCCEAKAEHRLNHVLTCSYCHHSWRLANPTLVNKHYSDLIGRNQLPDKYTQKKLTERVQHLSSYLTKGMSVLEVGCAEGDLGEKIKETWDVNYFGLEISRDAEQAKTAFDGVFNHADEISENQQFDLIINFHVLEHIPNLNSVISDWKSWLKPDGKLILEVPNKSGHPWVVTDNNPEHIHQFEISSISALLTRHGFAIKYLQVGFFESPCYINNIRLMATLALSKDQKQQNFIKIINRTIAVPFDIFCVGGDFKNYIEPIIEYLNVSCLFDNDPTKKEIANKSVTSFNVDKNKKRPILISSIRYEEEICQELINKNVHIDNIYYLSDILLKANQYE